MQLNQFRLMTKQKKEKEEKEQWIWEVSVRWAEWDETYSESETEAHELLQQYFDESENEGDLDINPTFRKFRVKNFKKVCPWHYQELIIHDGKLFCQHCKNDGEENPYPEHHEFTFEKISA